MIRLRSIGIVPEILEKATDRSSLCRPMSVPRTTSHSFQFEWSRTTQRAAASFNGPRLLPMKGSHRIDCGCFINCCF